MICLLGRKDFDYSRIENFFVDYGYRYRLETRVAAAIDFSYFSWLVSYNYPYLLPDSLLNRFGGKCINLHISYLPFNRGADPNLWSWIDNTPKGVTIHQLDSGIDTGDILVQKIVNFNLLEYITLRSTYETLHREIQNLFIDHWGYIVDGLILPVKQDINSGTFHKKSDRPNLPNGWDTKISDLIDEYTKIRR